MDRTLYITALNDVCLALNKLENGTIIIQEMLDTLVADKKIDISEYETMYEAFLDTEEF